MRRDPKKGDELRKIALFSIQEKKSFFGLQMSYVHGVLWRGSYKKRSNQNPRHVLARDSISSFSALFGFKTPPNEAIQKRI